MADSAPPTVEPVPDAPPTLQDKIVGGVGSVIGAVLKVALGVILENEPLRLKIADFIGTLTGAFAIKVGDHVIAAIFEHQTKTAVPDKDLQNEMPDSGDLRR